jgi:hypothetical protein
LFTQLSLQFLVKNSKKINLSFLLSQDTRRLIEMKKFQLNIRSFRKEQEALKNLIDDLNIKSNQTFQAIKNTGKEEKQKK